MTKLAQGNVFSQKKNDTSHPSLTFNNARIQQASAQIILIFF